MVKINDMNWQYRILQYDGRETPVNDFDSMIIGEKMKQIKQQKQSTMILTLPSAKLVINLYSSVMNRMNDKKIKVVKKANSNNRYDRPRP